LTIARWPPTRSRTDLLALLFLVLAAATAGAQSVSARVNGNTVHFRASGFEFIKGVPLARLQDGRSVPLDLELFVVPRPGAPPMTDVRQRFVVSYDLWEERFAVTRPGTPSRSVSHLSARDAEAWCLDQLTLPVSAFARLGQDAPFWVRLTYRIPDEDRSDDDPDAGAFTLRALIDKLSRRRAADDLKETIEAGPIRLK
jgi:hypothetical protein